MSKFAWHKISAMKHLLQDGPAFAANFKLIILNTFSAFFPYSEASASLFTSYKNLFHLIRRVQPVLKVSTLAG